MNKLTSAAIAAALFVLTACAGVGGTKAVSTPAESAEIFDYDYLMRDLDNGLRVVVLRTDYPDLVSLHIPVTTGSRNEVEPGKSGFAHFFEHMMFRGTLNRSAEEISAILKRVGADDNAYTSDDITNYNQLFTKDALETVLELQADRFKNLSFTEDQFRTEAQAVKGEYLKNNASPINKLYEAMRKVSFDVHPYGHTTMGYLEDINAMPEQFEYAKVFFDRWYRPQNASVIVVGDVNPEQTFALVKKHFGDWDPGQPESVEIPAEPAHDGPRSVHVEWASQTPPTVAIAFRGPAFVSTEKDMPAMDLIGNIYFGQTSELYQRLVVQQRVVDQLGTYFPNRKDPNLLMIYARVNRIEDLPTVSRAILEEVARARSEPVAADTLEATKSNLRYSFALALNNSKDIAGTLAPTMVYERTPETLNRQFQRYAELTPEDLLKYANRYLTDDRRTLATLSSEALPADMKQLPMVDELSRARASAAPALASSRFHEMPSASPLVDVNFLFKHGAAQDPPGKKGLAAITAAMIVDAGTAQRSYKDVLDAQYPIAAGLNSQVDKEMTRFDATVHREALQRWYALSRERLLTPGWRQEDLDRVKQQQINAIKTDLRGNNEEELAKEVLYETLYRDHPYGSLTLGHIADVQSISLDDVKAFYATHYTQAALSVGLAGNYGPTFVEQLKADLASLPAGKPVAREVAPAPALSMRRAIIVEKDTPSVAVSFGFPIDVARGHPDWAALWLARSWLGEHRSMNSHLFQRIREVRGMNYGDYAYIEYFPLGMFRNTPPYNLARQQQIFQIWLRPLRSNNDAHFATRTALFELQKLVDNGLSQEQFEATREFLSRYVAQRQQTQAQQLGYVLDSAYYGTPAFLDYVRNGLDALTLEHVNTAIKRHLQTSDLQFVFISGDAADLKERLILDTPSPLKYNAPVSAELAAEDDQIIASKLWFKRRNVQIVPVDQVFQ